MADMEVDPAAAGMEVDLPLEGEDAEMINQVRRSLTVLSRSHPNPG